MEKSTVSTYCHCVSKPLFVVWACLLGCGWARGLGGGLSMMCSLVVTLWDYEPNWLIVRLIVQTYVGIVLLSILSAPFSPPKKIIQNWLTNTYHGILKPYYDVSQMIYGIYASWICSSDSGLGFQSLGQVKGNGKCDPPLT